ncbi:RluA family pseudouridine synthase [Intestinibaculum porci]|uniref:RluA family pseudouridine synthase n=1 Tax=Intestinibaculum porci TaxID=2487118 RepID=UPI0024097E92|nr:RluA family pseudouridine synthase [Intestinibaculum porci]MDD6348748.1 RluA family pseudouridine synthase [Intestinibaculum porci]
MKLVYQVDADHTNMRLDDFFYKQGISKKLVKDSRNHGAILKNGQPVFLCEKTALDDEITIVFPKEESQVIPVKMDFGIVYEDDYLMVIDKPAHLATIPNRMYLTNSLGNALMYYYQEHGIESAIHFVNRLDKETQGLLLVAKSRYVHDFYSRDIKKVKRVYHALVEGHPGEGTIDAPIAHRLDHPTKRMIDPQGAHAITHYRTLKEYATTSLIECRLETGRTHQIRVHLASIGHPLVGDELYNDKLGNFYLDSVEIAFEHAMTHQMMVFKKRV